MELHADENIQEEDVIISSDTQETVEQEECESSKKKKRVEGNNNYGKKFSARLYKFFSLFMFFIYYLNFMVRIISNAVKYYNEKSVGSFKVWVDFTFNSANWKEMGSAIFDWYTITLLIFLALYLVVFLVTFIRYSPKHKKTFKFFKKGFVMARRVIKLISIALTLTVLVNSAQLATFSDKFLFVFSLFTIFVTVIQICISVTAWVWGKKFNKSVKKYVGNVMSNYIASARVRPQSAVSGKRKTVGYKLGVAKNRFLRTMEAMTLTKEEAMERDAEFDGYIVENSDITERFENDYQPIIVEESVEKEQPQKPKKERYRSGSKDKIGITKKSRLHKKTDEIVVEEQVASAIVTAEEEGKTVDENNTVA